MTAEMTRLGDLGPGQAPRAFAIAALAICTVMALAATLTIVANALRVGDRITERIL